LNTRERTRAFFFSERRKVGSARRFFTCSVALDARLCVRGRAPRASAGLAVAAVTFRRRPLHAFFLFFLVAFRPSYIFSPVLVVASIFRQLCFSDIPKGGA
jgi:hypothetical protein